MSVMFSIIIPNYNSFYLMEHCLKSLEEQTYKNFEVIIIDDCSTDDSYEQLMIWSKETNINNRIIKQLVNAGPGVARNIGIEQCKGKYVIFIDADDYVETEMLEKLRLYVDGGYDTIVFDAVHEQKSKMTYMKMFEKNYISEGYISNREAFVYIRGCPWGKAFCLDFIRKNNIRFGEYYCSEDIPFTKSALALSKSIFYLKESLYHYVDVNTSIMNSGIEKWNSENEANTEKIIDLHLRNKGFEVEIEAWKLRAIYPYYIFNMMHLFCSLEDVKSYVKSHYTFKTIINNKYIKQYPFSRQMLIYALSSHNMILIRLIYKIFCNW